MREQSWVFVVTFACAALVELMGEVALSRSVPRGSKGRFWGHYVIGASILGALGYLGFKATASLAETGHGKLAWATALIPSTLLLAQVYVIRGVDTALYAASGSNALSVAAGMAKKKCVTVSKPKDGEERRVL
jgi:hypothetical protein